jgi:hypothetical protein
VPVSLDSQSARPAVRSMSARPASANATTGGGETKYAAGPPGDLNMNLRSECPTVFLLPIIIAITIEALGELAGWCATRSERCMSVGGSHARHSTTEQARSELHCGSLLRPAPACDTFGILRARVPGKERYTCCADTGSLCFTPVRRALAVSDQSCNPVI